MKSLILIPFILCVVQADSSEKQDVKLKPSTSPPSNTIPVQKYEMYYPPVKYQQPLIHQQGPQQKPQYVPVQIIPRQYYMQQPQAMIIIAHPALVPQSLLYNNNNPTQQLLNYFHSNPQAKYQLLQGNYQQASQHIQPTYMHQVVAAPSYGNYILAAAPTQYQQLQPYQQYRQQYQHVVQAQAQPQAQTTPAHLPYLQSNSIGRAAGSTEEVQQQQPQPTQLSSIAQLAQLAAQQYAASPLKSAPAIVTGFENFTPQQQAQIKAQLSQHLGSDFHAVSANSNNGNENVQYSSKYIAEQDSKDFVPSPEVKNDMVMTTSGSGNTNAGNIEILKSIRMKERN